MASRPDSKVLDAIVFAGDLDSQKQSDLLLNQAHGWLKSAEWITVDARQAEPNGGVCHALPAMFALYHGIELLLKGVTCELTGSYDNVLHDIESLLADYETALKDAGRPELRIESNVQRFIHWDRACRPSGPKKKLPHGSDFRFILDRENKPSWPGVSIRYRDLVDWSREYRRDFARIRWLLFDVKGWGAFWEEGTFASSYPDQPLWFFCVCCRVASNSTSNPWEHRIADTRRRDWIAYEGEAINEFNHFITAVGKLPEPHLRLECSLNELPTRLGQVG